MENFDHKLWLVKVPEQIYNQVINHNDLGILEVFEKENENGKKEFEFKVCLGSKIDPNSFNLNISDTKNFFTFKEKLNKIRSIEKIGRFIASDEHISDMVTLRVAKEEETNKPSITIDTGKGRQNNQGRIIPISEHQFIATNDNFQKAMDQKIRKDKNLKKTRKDREELKTEIFSLFSNKKYWTNREIVAKLDQPENYLKEVLSEICNYIKSGPKKGCYELKHQYVNIQEDNN